MKELNIYDTLIQKEALINELKGNLFEFLVAKELASLYRLEASFIKSIDPSLHERLRLYEEWLREHSSDLLEKLPKLALETAHFFKQNFNQKIEGVLVVGKLAGGGHDERVQEADILLKTKDAIQPISLKLCKDNAFVNTKSGGVRSFFIKYFGQSFKGVTPTQKLLNRQLDESYKELSLELHRQAELQESTSFGKEWKEAGLPDLPGKLDPQMSLVLKEHNHKMLISFYKVWSEYYQQNRDVFIDCMMPLLGFGNKNLIQLSCFYKGDYELSRNTFKTSAFYNEKLQSAVLLSPKPGLSSFELEMEDCSFQLRLKAMNKFTVSGLKVNCSLKQNSSC